MVVSTALWKGPGLGQVLLLFPLPFQIWCRASGHWRQCWLCTTDSASGFQVTLQSNRLGEQSSIRSATEHIYSSGAHRCYQLSKDIMTLTKPRRSYRIACRAGKQGARSAAVPVLASVFEKSATEPKHNLLKCKHATMISTFNVRTL